MACKPILKLLHSSVQFAYWTRSKPAGNSKHKIDELRSSCLGPVLQSYAATTVRASQEALRCNRQLANRIVRQVARDMRRRPGFAEQAEMLRKGDPEVRAADPQWPRRSPMRAGYCLGGAREEGGCAWSLVGGPAL